MGISDSAGSCLFEIVVMISFDWVVGNRSSIWVRSWLMVVDEGSGRTKVGGRPRPAKLVTSTFKLRGDIISRDCGYSRDDVLV